MSHKMESTELDNRKILFVKFNENPKSSTAYIAKCAELPKSIAYDVIKRFKETLTVKRLSGSRQKLGPKTLIRSFVDHSIKIQGFRTEIEQKYMEHQPPRFKKRDLELA